MARLMHEGATEVFRAVVTLVYWKNGEPTYKISEVFGPFTDRRQASAAITRAEREANRRISQDQQYAARRGTTPVDIKVEASVEKSVVNWLPV